MKKSYLWWIFLGLLVLLTAVGCKSTPPQAEETPPTAAAPAAPAPAANPDDMAPDQSAINGLNAEADRAANARKLAADFGAQSLFSDDWNSADSLYTQADQLKSTATARNTRESTARYTQAADSFEALRDKTLAQYYDSKQKELVDARSAAIAAGADELVPDFLLQADNTVADAQTKYEAKDFYGAKDSASDALAMYTVLQSGLNAYKIREEIANRDFEAYDRTNINLADDTLRSAAADYTNKDYASAQAKCDQVLASYTASLKTAWQSYAAEKGADASTQRQKALDFKANVAVRQDFNAAQAVYTQGTTAFQSQKHEDAATLFAQSSSMFTAVAQAAQQKQQAAQEALDRANQKMQESDDAAKNAEAILQGGM